MTSLYQLTKFKYLWQELFLFQKNFTLKFPEKFVACESDVILMHKIRKLTSFNCKSLK